MLRIVDYLVISSRYMPVVLKLVLFYIVGFMNNL